MGRNPGSDEVDRVIRSFYEAALQPELWPSALDGMGDLLCGTAIGMTVQSKNHGARQLAYSRLDPACTAVMGERYFTAETNPMVAIMGRMSQSMPLARQAVISDSEYFGSDLYNEVFRPQSLAHAAVACAHRSSEFFVPLGMFRRAAQDEFDSGEYALLKVLLPHLQKALEVYVRISMLQHAQSMMEEGFEALPYGIVFLDAQGRVCKVNGAAEAILSAGDGLYLRNGKIEASLPGDSRALNGLVAGALSIASGRAAGSGGAISISRPSGSRPLSALVTPIPVAAAFPRAVPGVLLIVADPDRRLAPPEAVLSRLFGLTPTESRVASLLVTGLTIEQAARRMKIKSSTARAHLKSVFAKTETRRQSELIRVVLSSAAVAALAVQGPVTAAAE